MISRVSYFEIFCNLVHILHAAPAATKVKIQIWGFLQLGKAAKAKKGLDKLLLLLYLLFLQANGIVVKAACVETKSLKIACARIVHGW